MLLIRVKNPVAALWFNNRKLVLDRLWRNKPTVCGALFLYSAVNPVNGLTAASHNKLLTSFYGRAVYIFAFIGGGDLQDATT